MADQKMMPTKRPHLLIVEDDEMISNMLEDYFGEVYVVTCVAAAKCALAELARQRIDVLLLDYYLPGGCSQAVADLAVASHVPVVWMTGHPTAVTCLSQVPHVVLAKPFRLGQALGALTKALASSGRASPVQMRIVAPEAAV
jgi:DNA-binding NtrC family response regulator